MTTDVNVDICVFGAGAAGTTVAEALAQGGKSVALVEQGPRFSVEDRQKLIDRRTKELRTRDLDFSGGKYHNAEVLSGGDHPYFYHSVSGVGGATMHWEGHTPRPTEQDMQVRKLYGYGRDWPMSYAELEPWLVKAERKMGVSADDDNPFASPRSAPFPMPAHPKSYFESEVFGPAMDKLGYKLHSRPNAIASKPYDGGRSACVGCRACSVCPSGARYAADRVSLPGFLAAPKAKLHSEVKLRRLELGKDGKSVVAAQCIDADGKEVTFRAKSYILAMGAVETPRMLLLCTGKGHEQGIGNAGGQIGVGFQDHAMAIFDFNMPKRVGNSLGFPAFNTEQFRGKDERKDIATFTLNMIPAPVTWDWAPARGHLDNAKDGSKLSLERLRDSIHRSVVGYGMFEQTGKGSLVLDDEKKDEFGDALARVVLGADDRAMEGFKRRIEVTEKLADAFGAKLTTGKPHEFFWASHPAGGTAMGTSPKNGVVDTNMRVMGTNNLYVSSASTFPHMGANHPTLTIVALSLRLAAHLQGS